MALSEYEKMDRVSAKFLLNRERQLTRTYTIALREMREEMSLIYDKYSVGGKLSLAEMSKYQRFQNLDSQLVESIKRTRFRSMRTMTNAIKEGFEENFYHTGFAIEQQLGVGARFGLLNENQIAAALENPMDRITWPKRLKGQADTLVNQLRSTIVQGLVQGKGFGGMMKVVRERMEIGATKAMRILRTEVHRAQVEGQLQSIAKGESAAERLDLVSERVWVSNLDARVRPSHGRMDLTIAKNGDGEEPKFRLPTGERVRGPGLTGIAAEDINCRCRVRLQFKGYEPDARYIKGEGVVKLESYEDWRKRKGIKVTEVPDVRETGVKPNVTPKPKIEAGLTGEEYDKAQQKWLDSLTPKEHKSFEMWTGEDAVEDYAGDWRKFNLEGLKGTTEYQTFMKAVAHAPKKAGTFHRGLHDLSKQDAMKIVNAKEFELNTISSFSDKAGIAKEFGRKMTGPDLHWIEFRIKNSVGVEIKTLSAMDFGIESEILMAKGTKFRQIGIKSAKYKEMGVPGSTEGWIIDLEKIL